MMDFEYVVKRQEKARICFGSGMERKTLESDHNGLHTKHARYHTKENITTIMPGMYEPSELTSALGSITRRPTSLLGTVLGGRTATRKDKITSVTPSPGQYEIPSFIGACHPNKAPFNSRAARQMFTSSSIPGVGTYKLRFPKCHTIPFAHSFGGKKCVLPAVKMKCGPFYFDTCERCNEAPEGDYWYLDVTEAQRSVKKKEGEKRDIKQEGTFLCRPCYTIERNENKIFSKGQIRAFKKIRNCSKVHFHGGCKAKLYLVPPEEMKKLSVREGYLSLFFK